MTDMKDLELLQSATQGVRPANGTPPASPRHIAFRRDGVLYLTDEGFAAVSHLARNIQRNKPTLRRGAQFANVRKVVTEFVISLYADQVQKGPAEVSKSDLTTLKKKTDEWFAAQAATPRHHVVPCSVIPSYAPRFSIGPVTLEHICDFDQQKLGIDKDHPVLRVLWNPLFEPQMSAQAATWLAGLKIPSCDEQRSLELADVMVDIALACLQLSIGSRHARYMARATSRANPPYRGDLVVQSGRIQTHTRNMEAGRTLPSNEFQALIVERQHLLDSFGRRMRTFLDGQSATPKLDQGWCDGAYWFHQGLAEPLDTIAVAKLEIAMESLLAPENTQGSRRRIDRALSAMLGHAGANTQGASGTVFATRVVEARSRILHGTRSTTRDDVGVDRNSVEEVARFLILSCSIRLDEYAREEHVSDDAEAFLKWAEATNT